jgi:hypothetical protein
VFFLFPVKNKIIKKTNQQNIDYGVEEWRNNGEGEY